MKFLRVGKIGKEKPAVIDKLGNVIDISHDVKDFNPESLNSGLIDKIRKKIDSDAYKSQHPMGKFYASIHGANSDFRSTDGGSSRIGSCINKPGKFIGIGLNYSDHAEETGMKPPKEPIIFFKTDTSVSGPYDNVLIPKNSKKTDWEIELGIVIGKKAQYIYENESYDHIFGYCIINDISEREFQIERSGQWDKGKGCDTFGPIGPLLVTKDEIKDVQNLNLELKLNGKVMQKGNTSKMIFSVKHIVSYLSQFMTLNPGDIITTGTPPGVGMAKNPQIFLRSGDFMELSIENLGVQKQRVISLN